VTAVAARAFTSEEVAGLLQATAEGIQAEVSRLTDEVAGWHADDGEWCVKECIGHIVEAERRGFNGRIRLILEEPGRALQSWDQDEVAALRSDCDRPVEAVLQEFAELRRDSVELVRSLRDEDLEKDGVHQTVGLLSVRDLLHEWLHHDRDHFRQLLANVQAYTWPSMGGAQKFAGD